MKKQYIIVPYKDIWNAVALANRLSIRYDTKEQAINVALVLSRRYSAEFIVYCSLTLVNSQPTITELQ